VTLAAAVGAAEVAVAAAAVGVCRRAEVKRIFR